MLQTYVNEIFVISIFELWLHIAIFHLVDTDEQKQVVELKIKIGKHCDMCRERAASIKREGISFQCSSYLSLYIYKMKSSRLFVHWLYFCLMIGKYFGFHKGGESKEVFSSSSFKNYEKNYGKKVDFVPVHKSTAKASCSKVSVQSNRQSQSQSKNKGVLNAATKYKVSLILICTYQGANISIFCILPFVITHL